MKIPMFQISFQKLFVRTTSPVRWIVPLHFLDIEIASYPKKGWYIEIQTIGVTLILSIGC